LLFFIYLEGLDLVVLVNLVFVVVLLLDVLNPVSTTSPSTINDDSPGFCVVSIVGDVIVTNIGEVPSGVVLFVCLHPLKYKFDNAVIFR